MFGEPVSHGPADFCGSCIASSNYDAAASNVGNVVMTQYGDGVMYEGQLVDGKPDGHGFCVFPSGMVCSGNFSCGYLEGHADVLMPFGTLFSGVFRQSVAHGDGVCVQGEELSRGTWKDGELIECTWRNEGNYDLIRIYVGVATALRNHRHTLSTALVENEVFQQNQSGNLSCMTEPVILLHAKEPTKRSASFLSSTSSLGVVPTGSHTREPSRPPVFAPKTENNSTAAEAEMDGSFSYTMMKRRIAVGSSKKENFFPDSVFTTKASPHAIFASATPATNELFSTMRFFKYFVIFLFPFMSIPQVPFSPIRSVALEMEREFVVSGASLLHTSKPPVYSLCITTFALCCYIVAIVMIATKVGFGAASQGQITYLDVAIPLVLWVLQACIHAGYRSYMRLAHGLERLDRSLTPRLSAFAASIIDTKARFCVYTWVNEGQCVATSRRRRYPWLILALLVGLLMGLTAPITCALLRYPLFGRTNYEVAVKILIFISILLFSSTITYCVLKLTDMQRQVWEQMRILTRLAYLEGKSMMRPSEFLNNRFNFDEPINVSDVFSGVVGWYTTRSLVLYASMCSNHAARGFAMSIFLAPVLCVFMGVIVDAVYMIGTLNEKRETYFSYRHSCALVLCTTWGVMLLRYLFICIGTVGERVRHLYLFDVASLYHRTRHGNKEGCGEIIEACRRMMKESDHFPNIFSFLVTPLFLAVVIILYLFAAVSLLVNLYFFIFYG